MHMTEYETTVVVRPDIGGDAVEVALDRVRDAIKNNGGKLLAITHWGKKKLSYDIQKHGRGIYVHTHFLGGNTLVAELERNLRISDHVLRFMTIRLARNVDGETREQKAYERPQYDVEDPLDDALDLDADTASSDGDDDGAMAPETHNDDADEAPRKQGSQPAAKD